MSFRILGMGISTPPHSMSQEESIKLSQQVICRDEKQRRMLSVLYRKAGVKNRHTALPHRLALEWSPPPTDEDKVEIRPLGPTTSERMKYYAELAPPLAQEAAEQALAESRVAPDKITHLITVSCTGFEAPGIDVAIIARLGLPPTTQRVQVGFMGCHGAINGLRVAEAIASADPAARILLCAVELCSLHFRTSWDPERMVGNAIFADGAAALVGGGNVDNLTSEEQNNWRVEKTGSALIPDSLDAMSWKIGDNGFEMTLHARVPDLIRTHLAGWMSQWLAEQGQSLTAVQSWAVHPGGPRILDAVEESLELSATATAISREVLSNYGNMSSPTVLFIINRMRSLNARRPCVALGFGPGLFAEAALLL